MRFSRAWLGSAALWLMLLLVGCDSVPTAPAPQASATPQAAGAQGEIVVFAASSLKDAFEELAKGLNDKVTFNFAGSQALVTQLSQGAQADVFASADEINMEAAIDAEVVTSSTRRQLATNKLVVIVPPGGSAKVTSLNDLVKTGVKLVIADKTVPAGKYAEQLLDKLSADKAQGADYKERVLANVVSHENNVRQVLSKVQLGEADAGIVYVTDAKSTGGSGSQAVGTIPIPDEYNVLAHYYIAPLKDAQQPEAANRFIDYALSSEGQQTLEKYGFGPADAGK